MPVRATDLFRELHSKRRQAMKDNELRELLAALDRKIEAATAAMVGGDTKKVLAHIQERLDHLDRIYSEGRNQSDERLIRERLAKIDKALEHRMPGSIMLPSPRVPMIVGMGMGALLFTAGMLLGWLLLK